MVQTGMLALQLLPENSSATILIITDGVIRLGQQRFSSLKGLSL